MPCSGTLLGAGLCRGRGTLTPTLSQVRHNLLNVPQYDSVVADLRRDIQHLKGQRDTKPGQGERRDTSDIQGTARTPPALPHPPPGLGADAPSLQPRFGYAVAAVSSSGWRAPRCVPGTYSPSPGMWVQRSPGDGVPRRAGLGVRPPPPPRSSTRRAQRWSEEGWGEPDGPSGSEGDSNAGDERLDVSEPPDVVAARKSIAALGEEQGRLRQRKVWELKPHHQGAEFDESQPSSPGGTWIHTDWGVGEGQGALAGMLVPRKGCWPWAGMVTPWQGR